MIAKIRRYIDTYDLIEQGDRIVIGVSGGADSVCLLLCLAALRGEYGLDLQAVHVNHCLRGSEADADEAFTAELCSRLGVPCSVHRIDVKARAEELRVSEEEAGRIVRYEIFAEAAAGGKIAVAHHADDQAETILHNIIRGTGLKGLAGMQPRSGQIIRPLLCVTRAEIEAWLAEQGQDYCTDRTNLEDTYTRNKLRNSVIPQLEEINPGFKAHLLSLAGQAGEAYEMVSRQAEALWYAVDEDRTVLRVPELSEAPAAAGRMAARQAIAAAAGRERDISTVHADAVYGLRSMQTGSRVSLPYGLFARRSYDEIVISRLSDPESGSPGVVSVSRTFAYEKEMVIPRNDYTKWFDYDKIQTEPVWRVRRPGDVIALGGVGHKTVKSYMIDAKIPAELRDHIELLTDGDSVIWIPGYRISEDYKVTEETRTIYEVTVII